VETEKELNADDDDFERYANKRPKNRDGMSGNNLCCDYIFKYRQNENKINLSLEMEISNLGI
jgi:hypothetical protein